MLTWKLPLLTPSFASRFPYSLLTPRGKMQPELRDEHPRYTKHYCYLGNLWATVNNLYLVGKV